MTRNQTRARSLNPSLALNPNAGPNQARQYGRGLRAQLTSTQPEQPCVLCVEKPYLPGLIEVFEEERADDAPPSPFVLLA